MSSENKAPPKPKEYELEELVDVPALASILDTLYDIARIPSAIIDMKGKILTGAGWQRICTEFHRVHPEAEKICVASDTRIATDIEAGAPYAIYECPHGLVDSCCPVILEGRQIGNVFTGQMLHTPLDEAAVERFREQARRYGFDEEEYLAVLREVPVYPLDKHKGLLDFLSQFTAFVAGVGQARLRTMEQAEVIRESEAKLQSYIDNAPYGVFIMDSQGRYLEVNRAASEITGYSQEELLTMGVEDLSLVAPDQQPAWALQVLLREGRLEDEFSFLRKDGEVRWCRLNAVKLSDEACMGFTQDITDRRLLEEQLRQAEKLEAIGQLAGGVAHDFNNQLATILGYAELLLEELDHGSELGCHVESIIQAAERSASLSRQLLAFSRKGKYLSVTVDLHRVINEVADILGKTIDRRITIEMDLTAEPSTTLGDPVQLQSAILNLALNARDAMPDGGTLCFATELLEVPDKLVAVHVRDTGIGMDEDTRNRMFEPYFTTKEGTGTGLGLAAVYGTVKNHHGEVEVETAPGKGTTVSLLLQALSAPEHTLSAAADGVRVVTGSGHILVAEDEQEQREMLSKALQGLGYEVTACTDGEEAVALYRSAWQSFDMVILDIMMPRMKGTEAFTAMKAINPSIRALVASGYSREGEPMRMMEDGALGFLQKPYHLAELSQEVHRVMTLER